MRKAPWTDFAGNDLYEGDNIEHPSGEHGSIIYLEGYDDPADQWRVDYGYVDPSRLVLQVGDKGQAIKVG